MNKHIVKKALSIFSLLIISIAFLASCSTKKPASVKKNKGLIGKITVTEESNMNRLMENKPEVSHWFPKELLKWSFDKDKDAKFNVSTVPLQKRIAKEKLPKVNKTQNDKMKIVAVSHLNESPDNSVPRGYNTFDANTFSYWQYIDKMVYLGGSANEGIIIPPAADTIDAAHLNGVPILGTIFFPPTASGGKVEWLDDFLQKNKKGEFPIVDKLLEVADAYGFDGWFINQETDKQVTKFDATKKEVIDPEEQDLEDRLNQKRATLMKEFMEAYRKKADIEQEIMWYDSMTSKGQMNWQNGLTSENKSYLVDAKLKPVADDMFLNFWWNTKRLTKKDLLKKSQKNAENWNIDPYHLYAGIDLEDKGYNTPVNWKLFADKKNQPYTSLGLYAPDWTYSSSTTSDEIEEKENTLWVNSKGDPSQSVPAKGTSWPGISTYKVEQSAITTLPFVTNFNLGKGYNYFINGKKVSEVDWYNRSMQDIMPTYRYMFKHGKGNDLQSSFDYADAYLGGNSLKFRGTMNKGRTSSVKFYETNLKIEEGTKATTVAKGTENTKLDLVVELENGKKETIKGNTAIGQDWTEVSYDISKFEGEKIKSLGYEITSEKTVKNTYEIQFGELAIRPKMENKRVKVRSLQIEDVVFDEGVNFAGIRMFWDEDNSPEIDYYEVYRVNKDKTYSFMGATPANTLYINGLQRNDNSDKTKFIVVAVNKLGNRGEISDPVTLKWTDDFLPKVSFKASQTLIAPGSEVTFENTSSLNTQSVKWEFEGGSIKTSTESNPKVTYNKEGTYNVKITGMNEDGTTTIEKSGLIVVSNDVTGRLSLLSKNAKVTASSFTNEKTAPRLVIDGKLNTKWATKGKAPHILNLDLKKVQTVSEVKISHAGAGGENLEKNTSGYTIELSEDGKKWERIVQVVANHDSETKDTFAPRRARYVRITVDKPTQGEENQVGIYEVAVRGLNN